MEPNNPTYKDYQRACQLATESGFFKAYFDALSTHRTYVEAFLSINEETFDHFGEHKYSSWQAFRMRLQRSRKKKTKK